MSKKITWDVIYKDFKSRHPNLSREVEYWCPHSYVSIKLYFLDGRTGVYKYFEHEVNFISDRWK